MAKMYFAKKVKYLGSVYPANTAFEVKEQDLQNLKDAGGWVIESAEVEEVKVEDAPEEDWSLEELKEIAASKGIEVKGNWGIKKLKQVIAEA